MTHDNEGILLDAILLAAVGVFGWFIANLHEILGNIFLLLSIAFLIWKWAKEAKKKEK